LKLRVATAIALAGLLLGAGGTRAEEAADGKPLEATSETGPVRATVRL
jgi:hypothetical protein